MRVVKLAILAIVTKVVQSQQLIDSLPSCAQPCMTAAISDVECDLSDRACVCAANKVALLASSATCLLTSCSASDITATKNQYTAFCAASVSGTTRARTTSTVKSVKPTSTSISASSITSTTSRPATNTVSSETSSTAQPSSTTASTATATATPESPTSASTQAVTAAPQVAGSGGLTAGAAAGVGIGTASAVVILALAVWFCLRRRQSQKNLRMGQDPETSNVFSAKRGYEMMPSSSVSTATVEATAGNSTQMQELEGRALPRPYAEEGADAKMAGGEAAPLSTTNLSSGRGTSTAINSGSFAQNVEPVELDSRPITSTSPPSSQVPSALVPAPWRWQDNHGQATEQPSSTISPVSPR